MTADRTCSYCGLPLASGWWWWSQTKHASACDSLTTRPIYCCSGCRFAAEVMEERAAGAVINKPLARLGIAVFFTVNVVMFTMVLWADDIYPTSSAISSLPQVETNLHLAPQMADVFRWLTLALSAPVVWLLAGPLVANAWQELRRGVAAVDLLLVLGVMAAFFYSLASVVRGEGHVYFEIVCVVLVLVTLGRWFESVGKLRATEAIESLAKLLPPTARRLVADSEEIVTLNELRALDQVRVLAGERIPADGCIFNGFAAIDEQLVTGESHPTVKQIDDNVFGGTLNLDGQLVIEVAADAGQGALQRMVEAIQQARVIKGRYQRIADRIAAFFLPATIILALAAASWHAGHYGVEHGVQTGLTVLLIACPCALGLATPLAVWMSLGRASRYQVLFRHGDAIEKLAAVKQIFFDKTGTLSSGECEVIELQCAVGEETKVVSQRAAALTQSSNHPYSVAITRYVGCSQAAFNRPLAIRALPGRGLIGAI